MAERRQPRCEVGGQAASLGERRPHNSFCASVLPAFRPVLIGILAGSLGVCAFAQKGGSGSSGGSSAGSAGSRGSAPASAPIGTGSASSPYDSGLGYPNTSGYPQSMEGFPGFGPAIPMMVQPAYDASSLTQTEACTNWTEAGFHSPTVSATRLAVPGKASGEYQKACGAFKDKKWREAEEHIRKAIAVYPTYAAAWVVLGQVLDGEQKQDDAKQACTQAMSVDSAYVPPYLCLAALAVRQQDWDQVSVLSDRAMALDPVSNPFAFYFTALSQLHFEQLHQAEGNALAALRLDTWHHLPELHYVLAQVYRAQGDFHDEALHLREYLKLAPPDSKDAPTARSLLAQIDLTAQK